MVIIYSWEYEIGLMGSPVLTQIINGLSLNFEQSNLIAQTKLVCGHVELGWANFILIINLEYEFKNIKI